VLRKFRNKFYSSRRKLFDGSLWTCSIRSYGIFLWFIEELVVKKIFQQQLVLFNIKFHIYTAGVSSEIQTSFSKKCLKFSQRHILAFTSGFLNDSFLDFRFVFPFSVLYKKLSEKFLFIRDS
jgi:hypothetical protein